MTLYDLEEKYTEILQKTHAYLVFGPSEVRKEIRGIIETALNFYQRNCEHDLMQVYFETMEFIDETDKTLDISTKERIYSFNRHKTTLTEDMDDIRRMLFKMQERHDKEIKDLKKAICAPNNYMLQDHDNMSVKIPKKETYEELIIRKLGMSKMTVTKIQDTTGLDYDKTRKAVTRLFRKDLLKRETINGEMCYVKK